MQTKINTERCKGCGLCVITCLKDLITMSEDLNKYGFSWAEITNIKNCSQCALCCQICPDIAIEIRE